MMKTRWDNNVINHTGAFYTKNDIKLLRSIGPNVVFNETQTGQWSDYSYRCNIHWKQYWIIVTNGIGCQLWWKPNRTTMWLIIQMRSISKTKLSSRDQLNRVWSMTKTRLDNDVVDHIGLFYAKTKTELWGPIWSDVIYDENQIGQQCDQSYRYVLRWKRCWTIMIDQN